MMLKLSVDTLDDVDPAQHGLYEQRDDGRFHLIVEGVEDTAALKRTNEALRRERDGAAREAREFKQKVEDFQASFQGVDPEQIKELLTEREQKKEEEAHARGETEKLYKEREERKDREHKAEMEKLTKKNEELTGTIRTMTKRTDIAAALDKIKAHPMMREFADMKLDKLSEARLDEDGVWRTYVPDGDDIKPVVDYAVLWSGTEEGQKFVKGPQIAGGGAENGPGTGGKGGVNPFMPNTRNLTEQGRLYRENPALYERYRAAAQAAGHKVTGIPLKQQS